MTTPIRTLRATVTVAAIALLAACSAVPADSGPDPDAVDPAPPAGSDAADCLTGGPWSLDLPDYAEQAQSYLVGLGIPISDFTMAGSQTVQFTDDGPLPISVHSDLGGSGDWSIDGSGMMTIDNWAAIGSAPTDPATGIELPAPDYSSISPVGVTCQPGLLTLTAPESPFVPLFTR